MKPERVIYISHGASGNWFVVEPQNDSEPLMKQVESFCDPKYKREVFRLDTDTGQLERLTDGGR